MTLWKDLAKLTAETSVLEFLSRFWEIKILVVADTDVSLGPEQHPKNLNEAYFGMAHLLEVLSQVGHVTKAHYSEDPLDAPGVIENFRFDRHDLTAYHQIWLLGFDTGVLPMKEQAAVADFMNKGGGVLATGDHAGLGSFLAGHLPRIRSMRRWNAPPPAIGRDRVDTTRPDAKGNLVFENQSDDIPQLLDLKYYEWGHRSSWTREIYPHPVLCSASGPITEFPDHMHEGEVIQPTDLAQVVTFDGRSFPEYPPGKDGKPVAPEIIAWGYTTGLADPAVMSDVHRGDPGPAKPRWTGAVGVYDGTLAGVGRIVVDSTFHHFFDINLIGDNAANRPTVTDPRAPIWRKGFNYSPQGQAVLAKIDQYFRNIVHWLSPGLGLYNSVGGLVAQIALDHRVREVIEGGGGTALQIGAYAWKYAIRFVPPCTLIQLVLHEFRSEIEFPIVIPDPLHDPDPRRFDWPIPISVTAQAALGGALLASAELESLEALAESRSIERLRAGMAEAVHELVRDSIEQTESSLAQLAEVERRLSSRRARGSTPDECGSD